MKKSIVISTQPTKFKAATYFEDLEKSVKKIAQLGYDGVELAIRNPKELDTEKIIETVKKYKLEVPAIGTGQAYVEEGLSFCSGNKAVRRKAITRIKDQIKLASNFNAKVIIGLIRGNLEGKLSKIEAEKLLKDSLTECLDYAEKYDIELSFEPLNRYDTKLVNTVSEGINLIEKIGKGNLGLLVDTFHMNIEEASIEKSIIKARKYINHIHIADSNRWALGYGHINFKSIFDTLKVIRYEDYISAEILPKPEDYAKKTIQYLNKILGEKKKK